MITPKMADGLTFDFACGDEVYGSCTELREFLQDRGQAYVLRVASSFVPALAAGTAMTCAEAVKKLLKGKRGWELRSAGRGSKGERWYGWAWLGTAWGCRARRRSTSRAYRRRAPAMIQVVLRPATAAR